MIEKKTSDDIWVDCINHELTGKEVWVSLEDLKKELVAIKKKYKLEMTFANGLKSVVSRVGSVPRTSLNINLSLASQGRFGEAKVLLCDMLRGTSPIIGNAHLSCGGGRYDYESISAFQSANTRFRCQDCGCEEWKSLQVQYQLSHNMDTKISQETIVWTGERSAK